jgi:hypothetical protein
MTTSTPGGLPTEHPSFKRARELEGPLANHFPTTSQDAADWEPIIRIRALHCKVLAVARSRVEFAWAAYLGPVPGMNHDEEYDDILRHGSKMDEDVARILFPIFKGVPYAR